MTRGVVLIKEKPVNLSPSTLLKLAVKVYEGLTEEEMDEVEAIACQRSD
jgi:hypothetical protein